MIEEDRITLTAQQRKAQRNRSIALAVALLVFVVLVYFGSIAKFGATL